jgi:peptide/nickel transport system ATP-binding protein
MSVVRHISNRVAVMYVGKLVELAESEVLMNTPKHPYTEALLSAVPRPNPSYQRQRIILRGDAADPTAGIQGCVFHPRCRYAEAICKTDVPPLVEVAPAHYAACHFADRLKLQGVAAAYA